MIDRSLVEPTSAPLRDVRLLTEFVDFVYAVGFYVACGFLGLLPRAVGRPLLTRYVAWASSMDEKRAR